LSSFFWRETCAAPGTDVATIASYFAADGARNLPVCKSTSLGAVRSLSRTTAPLPRGCQKWGVSADRSAKLVHGLTWVNKEALPNFCLTFPGRCCTAGGLRNPPFPNIVSFTRRFPCAPPGRTGFPALCSRARPRIAPRDAISALAIRPGASCYWFRCLPTGGKLRARNFFCHGRPWGPRWGAALGGPFSVCSGLAKANAISAVFSVCLSAIVIRTAFRRNPGDRPPLWDRHRSATSRPRSGFGLGFTPRQWPPSTCRARPPASAPVSSASKDRPFLFALIGPDTRHP